MNRGDQQTCRVTLVSLAFPSITLKRREGDVVYASVAQAFSNEIEPFALKGALVPHDQRRDRQPYLTERAGRRVL